MQIMSYVGVAVCSSGTIDCWMATNHPTHEW